MLYNVIMKEVKRVLGDKLKELREDKNMSQKALADKLGVTQQAVGKWERGKSEPDIATINKLADIFEVNTDYLLGRIDDPSPTKPRELPQTVAPYLADGLKELTPEARKEVMDFIEYVKVKYAKKDGDDKK